MKYYILLIASLSMFSCSNFLELNPDKKMDIPNTLIDCDLLLNDYTAMNSSYPALTSLMGEEFYMNTEDWESIPDIEDRLSFIWADDARGASVNWMGPYKAIYVANQVLLIAETLSEEERTSEYGRMIMGNAYFFRAFGYQQLLELYCLPYDESAATKMGLPIKLTPDLVSTGGRATLSESYDLVIRDYQKAIRLLPTSAIAKSRPNRTAAYAGIARLYLDMQDYVKAYHYADSAWTSQPTLMDYNSLELYDEMSIPKNNEEIIFAALTTYSGAIGTYYSRINPTLIDLYEPFDLRMLLYYQHYDFDPGNYGYKTNYDQSYTGLFIGLTTSEILLIRSESAARMGDALRARADINLLRKYRFDSSKYSEVTWTDSQLLTEILKERRRELIFRGRRWADLKRLNNDAATQTTVERIIDGTAHKLSPHSLKFAAMIPEIVIQSNPKIEQNKR